MLALNDCATGNAAHDEGEREGDGNKAD